MPKLKHLIAVYYDENNSRHIIRADVLVDLNAIELAKRQTW